MSCIVALSGEGRIYMGSDSCISWEDEQRTYKNPKIFIEGDYLIGGVGSPRPLQILTKYWKAPERESDFSESIREILSKYGCVMQNEDQIEIMQMSLIVAHNCDIFEITSDFSKNHYENNYSAIGCGRPYALASLYENIDSSMFQKEHDNKLIEKVIRALKCSEYFCMGVRSPFSLYTNEKQFSNKYKKLEIKI